MKKLSIFLTALLCAHFGLCATGEQVAAARAEILKGVSRIDAGGGALPGGFILLGNDAFPLAECRNYDGTCAFAAAGAFYGKGRVAFLGHMNMVTSTDQKLDTPTFLRNLVAWEAHGKADVRVAALRNGGIVAVMDKCGVKATAIQKVSELKDYDVVITAGINRDENEAILDFVRNGGGLIQSSLGWGFMFSNKSACFAEAFNENRVSGEIGALMGLTGVNRIGDGFPVACDKIPAGTTVDEAIELVVAGKTDDPKVRKQVAKTLSDLINALPSGVRPGVHAKIADLMNRPDLQAVPSPAKPLGAESIFARLAILAKKNAWLADPEKVWPADPGAAVYPGLVRQGTPSIERTIPIDLNIPRWHSTGVYSPAGQVLTVTIPEAAMKLGLKVRVGSTADDLSGSAEWKRNPLVTVEIPLVKMKTVFASPFGGLVYIVVPDRIRREKGTATGQVEVALHGGVMAPWFKLGRDTNEKFIRECAETGAPYGEIEGKDFILSAETVCLKKVSEPEWISEFWDKVLLADQELAQWKMRKFPERSCSDVQLTCGWLHNGYPLMYHVNDQHFDFLLDKERLAKEGEWGVMHELGHNHQNRAWTPAGTGEVTVNLFTMYAIETVSGADLRDERYPCGLQKANRRVSNWVRKGKSFEDWKKDYFLALELYLRIKEAYGWDAYKKTFARYREPGFRQPSTDSEKWDTFACELSKAVEADMGAVLTAWSIPLSESAKAECAKYPPAKESLTYMLGP